jgi:hypothetical protein
MGPEKSTEQLSEKQGAERAERLMALAALNLQSAGK